MIKDIAAPVGSCEHPLVADWRLPLPFPSREPSQKPVGRQEGQGGPCPKLGAPKFRVGLRTHSLGRPKSFREAPGREGQGKGPTLDCDGRPFNVQGGTCRFQKDLVAGRIRGKKPEPEGWVYTPTTEVGVYKTQTNGALYTHHHRCIHPPNEHIHPP